MRGSCRRGARGSLGLTTPPTQHPSFSEKPGLRQARGVPPPQERGGQTGLRFLALEPDFGRQARTEHRQAGWGPVDEGGNWQNTPARAACPRCGGICPSETAGEGSAGATPKGRGPATGSLRPRGLTTQWAAHPDRENVVAAH